jgi:hypothetical protein
VSLKPLFKTVAEETPQLNPIVKMQMRLIPQVIHRRDRLLLSSTDSFFAEKLIIILLQEVLQALAARAAPPPSVKLPLSNFLYRKI